MGTLEFATKAAAELQVRLGDYSTGTAISCVIVICLLVCMVLMICANRLAARYEAIVENRSRRAPPLGARISVRLHARTS